MVAIDFHIMETNTMEVNGYHQLFGLKRPQKTHRDLGMGSSDLGSLSNPLYHPSNHIIHLKNT